MMKMLFGWLVALVPLTALFAVPLHYFVSGASNKWVQNFFIPTKIQPDGTVNTWSHWDEGGKKFGVYKDGDVSGDTNVNPNRSLSDGSKTIYVRSAEIKPTNAKP